MTNYCDERHRTHTHTHDTSRIHYWEQYYICCKYISSCLSLIIINYTPIVIIDIARVSSGRVLSFSPTTRNVCDFSFLYVSLYFSYILFLAWTSRSHLFFAILSFPFKILWTSSPYLICFFFFGFPYAHCPVFLFFSLIIDTNNKSDRINWRWLKFQIESCHMDLYL